MSIHAEAPKPLRNFWSFYNDCLQRQEGLSPEEAPQFVHLDPHKLFEFGVPNDNFNVDDAVSNLLKLPPFDG